MRLIPDLLLCAVLVIGSIVPAEADCLSRCLGSCSFYDRNNPYEVGRCGAKQGECGSQCAGVGSHNYGAIAYSPATGAHAWSNKYDTRQEAESRALSECGARADDCEVEVWFDGTCAAIAVDSGGHVSWALGDTARAAQVGALEKCRAGEGQNCDLVEDACSRGDAD